MSAKMTKAARNLVYARDGKKCRYCGTAGSRKNKLTIHHIKPRCTHPHLVNDVSNCIVLCTNCHRAIHQGG